MPCFICQGLGHNRRSCIALEVADTELHNKRIEYQLAEERRVLLKSEMQCAQQTTDDLLLVLQAAQNKRDGLQAKWDSVKKKPKQKDSRSAEHQQQVKDPDVGWEDIASPDGIFWEEVSLPVAK